MSVKATVLEETESIHKYTSEVADRGELLREYFRQQQIEHMDVEQIEEVSWQDKPSHRLYQRQIVEMNYAQKSYQWLGKAALRH